MPSTATSSRIIEIEHVFMTCKRSFEEVQAALENKTPRLDPQLIQLLAKGDQPGIADHQAHGPPLFLFLSRDHGALLAIAAGKRRAIQYEIGNPITASTMTRHQLGAALYAPLRVVLYETDNGEAVFEYDRPSSLFGQFGDERVSQTGRELDCELEALLTAAAG